MMTAAERKKLQLYVRLILSYGDFKQASRSAQYLLHEHDYPQQDGDDLILQSLYCTTVVAYARPFNSRGRSRFGTIAKLGADFRSTLTADEQQVHDYILHCRNRVIAHTDAEAADAVPFVATDLPCEMVVPEKNDVLAPFTREYTVKVAALADKAFEWCVYQRRDLEPQIIHLLERRPFQVGSPDAPS